MACNESVLAYEPTEEAVAIIRSLWMQAQRCCADGRCRSPKLCEAMSPIACGKGIYKVMHSLNNPTHSYLSISFESSVPFSLIALDNSPLSS